MAVLQPTRCCDMPPQFCPEIPTFFRTNCLVMNNYNRVNLNQENTQAEAEVEALKSRISDLEEALRIERLRNQLNEKIIDIAEQRWHIEIRKKAGTKQ